jgi:hypothetical protein
VNAVVDESNANVAYWEANRAVVLAAREYRNAKRDYSVRRSERLENIEYARIVLFAALEALDKLEKPS